MNKRTTRNICTAASALTFAAVILHCPCATAASMMVESAEAVADTSRIIDLDEIVVVSQPKENVRLRKQPLSSNVFTDDGLWTTGTHSLASLSRYVPSFVVPEYGSRYTSSVYVRGIGSRSGDPSVGMYFDNIPLVNKSTYNRHLYMLDRVDVLRGPQGTLYGMNTEGGVVRLYTKNPMNYQGTDINIGIGTAFYRNVEVSHYHRPSDRFAFSAAAFYTGLDGFFDNANLGGKADLSNEGGGRMRFMWNVTPQLTADLTADYQYVNQNAFAYGEYDKETNRISDPSTTFVNGYKRHLASAGLNLSYTAGDLLLSSSTGYQFLDDDMRMDQDYLPADYLGLEQSQLLNVITQELTLRTLRPSFWNHTSGLFVSRQWLRIDSPVTFGDDMNSQIVDYMGMPSYVAQLISINDNYVLGTFHTPMLNVGIYHETTLNIADRLHLTAGLRYDFQRVEIDYDTQSRFVMRADMGDGVENTFRSTLSSSASENYHQLLPKFAIAYDIDAGGSNVYASLSKGFRAGGYNLQMFSDIFRAEQTSLGSQLMQLMYGDMDVTHYAEDYANVTKTIAYEPETSWNWELGTHLNFLENRLHADVAAFYTRVSNQQLSVMASAYGYGRMMINAGRSASLGAELSLRGAAVGDRLQWAATYSYTHATFRDYVDSTSTGEQCNYRGKRVPYVPAHTFSLTADYRVELGRHSSVRAITIGGDVTGNGPTYWDTDNTYKQKFYALLSLRVGLDMGRVRLNVCGRNITSTRYATFLVTSSATGTEHSFAQRGTPFQFGVDASIHL